MLMGLIICGFVLSIAFLRADLVQSSRSRCR
jgi:hypothetical protein